MRNKLLKIVIIILLLSLSACFTDEKNTGELSILVLDEIGGTVENIDIILNNEITQKTDNLGSTYFTDLDIEKDYTISIVDTEIGKYKNILEENILMEEKVSRIFTVQYKDIYKQEALGNLITISKEVYNKSVEGDNTGEYSNEAKIEFGINISNAENIYYQSTPSLEDLSKEIETLNEALFQFKSSIITKEALTIMLFVDADNDLENLLLDDLYEVQQGLRSSNINVIALVDRISGGSKDEIVLGENFTDTRLYKILPNGYTRLKGGTSNLKKITKIGDSYELNMGDPQTLKEFINYSKKYYPAEKYFLIISDHGTGPRGLNSLAKKGLGRAINLDSTSNDIMYTAEISDVLTSNQSVDLLGFDACYMGNVEIAYQFAPNNYGDFSANYLIGSAPLEDGAGWPYKKIFSRIGLIEETSDKEDETLGGNEKIFSIETMTTKDFAAIVVEERRDYYTKNVDETEEYDEEHPESLGAFDLSKVKSLKNELDKLAEILYSENLKNEIENLRGSGESPVTMHYFEPLKVNEWVDYPLFDLYDLIKRIKNNSSFSVSVRSQAVYVLNEVDSLVQYSFGGTVFNNFEDGKNGISIFFPDGDREEYSVRFWEREVWYNAIDTSIFGSESLYGKLDWCIDNASQGNNKVENWFEMLDAWFDIDNLSSGGLNKYQY